MAKSRKPLTTFDLTGIAYEAIEGDDSQESPAPAKERSLNKDHQPEPSEKSSSKKENEQIRVVSKKMTGVRLYEDQLDTLREMEYRQRRRNITTETVRIALDEYFERHHIK